VNVDSSSKGSYTTAVAKTTGDGVGVTVYEATPGAGWNGTVKVTFNGVLLATKSGKITGDITKLTASPIAVGKKGKTDTETANAKVISFRTYDSAGNEVAATDTSLKLDSSSNPTIASAIAVTSVNDLTTGASGKIGVSCDASGSSDLVFNYVNEGGGLIKSNKVAFNCGDEAATYTASFDKSSYKQGEVATLTIKFLDTKGNPANSSDVVSNDATADQVITAPQMVRVTDASGYTKGLTADETGVAKYVFTVGTDSGVVPGTYNAVVSFPTINDKVLGAANQSVAYTITSSGTSISNAEVLAAIVKLIASINKQITALQKLLTKKK